MVILYLILASLAASVAVIISADSLKGFLLGILIYVVVNIAIIGRSRWLWLTVGGLMLIGLGIGEGYSMVMGMIFIMLVGIMFRIAFPEPA